MVISPVRDAIFLEKYLPTFNSPVRDGIIEKWLMSKLNCVFNFILQLTSFIDYGHIVRTCFIDVQQE